MINAWINGNNKKRPHIKLSASKFNEKNVFRQFQKEKKISQMSAVRTGVRAYMDATPLPHLDILNLFCHSIASFTGTDSQLTHQLLCSSVVSQF